MNRKTYCITEQAPESLTAKIIKIITALSCAAVILVTAYFPELFILTERKALKSAVEQGEPEAISYYQRHYINHNINLFEN